MRIILIVSLAFLVISKASHAEILDVSSIPAVSGASMRILEPELATYAQTFRINTSGTLTGVGVDFDIYGSNPWAPINVSIFDTVDGRPNQQLASSTITAYDIDGWDAYTILDITRIDYNINVTAGDVLAIVINRDAITNDAPEQVIGWALTLGSIGPQLIPIPEGQESFASYDGGLSWELTHAFVNRNEGFRFDAYVSPVPVPGAAWLFLSALGALGYVRRN